MGMPRTTGAGVAGSGRSNTTRDGATSGDETEAGLRPPQTLLERAGVIGADVIAPDDPGHRLIPAPAPAPPSPQPVSADSGAWAALGMTEREIAAWERVGASPSAAAALRRLGVGPGPAGAAPVPPEELVGWMWHGFAIDEISAWLPHGSVRSAVRRRDAGLGPGAPAD